MTLPVVTLPEAPAAAHVEACSRDFTQLLGHQALPLPEEGGPARQDMQQPLLLAAAAVTPGLCTLLGRSHPTLAAAPCEQQPF